MNVDLSVSQARKVKLELSVFEGSSNFTEKLIVDMKTLVPHGDLTDYRFQGRILRKSPISSRNTSPAATPSQER